MSIVWFISQDVALPELLAQMLPMPVTVVRFETAVSAFQQLTADSTAVEPVDKVDLILWDVVDKQMVVSAHGMAEIDIPVIAILPDAALRTAALAAGADDYLLRPFIPHEINTRLLPYLDTLISPLHFLLTALEIRQGGVSFLQALTECLEMEWTTEGILSAGLYLWDDAQQTYVSSLPTMLSYVTDENGVETAVIIDDDELLDALALPQSPPLSIVPAAQISYPLPNTAALLIVPLFTHEKAEGLLLFRCSYLPHLTPLKREEMTLFGQVLGNMLAIAHLQEEAQAYAIQTAFMVLIAKMLSELSDPNAIVTTTMEHVSSLLNVAGSAIWLLSADKQWLELSSMMSNGSTRQPANRIPVGEGFAGWVAQHNTLLNVSNPSENQLFHADYDQATTGELTQVLTVPLFHAGMLGVMQVHNVNERQFSQHDIMLLEGISGLLSSSLVNAQLVLHLREQAKQHEVLYDMSRQLASALDLPITLHRALDWAMRLSTVDMGLLWMLDEDDQRMKLVDSLGVLDTPIQKIQLAEQSILLMELMKSAQAVIIDELSPDDPYFIALRRRLPLDVQNLLIIPIIHHRKIIGALNLINKVGEEFSEADKLLLAMASDMVAIAIGNAQLHTRMVTLMDERQRLSRYAIQTARLATVGRLTASLAHEINNPMQAIKGAMDLVLEELDDPEALRHYAELSIRQVNRVTDLVQRMQQIYRPQGDKPEAVLINKLLQDTITDARKEMGRQKVTLGTHFTTDVLPVWAIKNQLHLVFLSIMLHLCAEMGEAGGGLLKICSCRSEKWMRIEFITAVNIPSLKSLLTDTPKDTPRQIDFGLSFSQDIIQTYDGKFDLLLVDNNLVVRIDLPPMKMNYGQ